MKRLTMRLLRSLTTPAIPSGWCASVSLDNHPDTHRYVVEVLATRLAYSQWLPALSYPHFNTALAIASDTNDYARVYDRVTGNTFTPERTVTGDVYRTH